MSLIFFLPPPPLPPPSPSLFPLSLPLPLPLPRLPSLFLYLPPSTFSAFLPLPSSRPSPLAILPPPSLLSTTPIVINKDNLAYLAALFPESESMRERLITRKWRPKQPLTPGIHPTTNEIADTSFTDIDHHHHHQQSSRYSQSYGSLLSTDVITGQKDQVLFLLVLVS